MIIPKLSIILADDDSDDCLLFKEALDELGVQFELTCVAEGEKFMSLLKQWGKNFPQVMFLDLNMPRKNGMECLLEIKKEERLKNIPVVIISTSYNPEVAKVLYNNGAWHYIQKPRTYEKLKLMLNKVLEAVLKNQVSTTPFKNFVLLP
jgi:CheY-like chemotaxis protein